MFEVARPVWPAGLEKKKNIHVGFRSVFTVGGDSQVFLRLTGATLYRVFMNGEFIQHGPARGPHGFYRVDVLNLSSCIVSGDNLLAIEVVGYNCCSFAYLNQSSFLQAELVVGTAVMAATGGTGFDALILPERIQKLERYSFQRPFVEAYCMAPGFDDWRNQIKAEFTPLCCEVLPEKKLLPRGVALSEFKILPARTTVSVGRVDYSENPVNKTGYWWMNDPHYKTLGSFMPEEFELDILHVHQSCIFSAEGLGQYRIVDLGTNLTGFIQLKVSCKTPIRLLVVFDEVLVNGDVGIERNHSLNLIYYQLQPGAYELESIEPYTFRYLKLIQLDGEADVSAGLREYVNDQASKAEFECSDADLNQLFEAGRQTFRQNAADLYMDCPGRERAGWLCDSFFTGRVEPLLCGNSAVEHNFIENFAVPERFMDMPDGMLPMCYPSDHPGGRHIPQWAMWLVIELEEYLQRTGDTVLVMAMKPKVFGLLNYFKPFINSDGLLEKLPSWNFIEWSQANKLTEDVNYPTNMLYARMLESAARLYDAPELVHAAAAVHETVRKQSFAGKFFIDNAVRNTRGALVLSGQSTEVCQYYAFFCGTASPAQFSGLWRILLEQFGPGRRPGIYDAVYPANVFIGYYLRMELLARYGEQARLIGEMKGLFLEMARKTGTLWEHKDVRASCNHGFASHVCVHLFRDLLGVRRIDPVNKTVEVLVSENLPLTACRGRIPLSDGFAEICWEIKDGKPASQTVLPPEWRLV